ncbi:lysosomal thioesterase PPT2-A-like [Limanda limanda]|uniref:lysosomal thioesterase PPT2-A-like n=1 Tax=Limanda limanda TaxID=27771 RepID=UPI0029C9AB5F|nr:lysosomal thioesterase PPT2-A-like [Limanda limanda]
MKNSRRLLLLLAGVCIYGYKPVVIVHGIFDGPKQFKTLSLFISKVHPGTEVSVIDLYNNVASLKPMWRQVQDFRKAIESIMSRAPDGIHLLCFSQGGLICRAVLSTTPDHNVHTFISLSSPQAGQYGDPHHRPQYLQSNNFLPMLNGDRPHSDLKAWRKNFLRIKKLVLIGGPDDGVITPQFGFYDSDEHVVEMRKQEFYRNDTFGLKTLDARGAVSTCVQSGVKHVYWHNNITVFRNCIEKWLT